MNSIGAHSRTLAKQRYFSLDILRGLTIALMVLVNTPGSWSNIYAPFKHAAWHGFTLTDLVFPTFLFVIGNAMSFSLGKYEARGEWAFLFKIIKRSLLIFIIGLFLNAFPFVYREGGELLLKDLGNIRIMGVLQRIAVCYLIAALLLHYLTLRNSLFMAAIILLAYWWIMWNFGTPPAPYSLSGNAVLKFDLLLFPKENLWKGFGLAFDPESLLSSLPATVNIIAGFACGRFIQAKGNRLETAGWLFGSGLLLVAAGLVWDNLFPINKGIWTSSFVIFSTGWDLIILGSLILIIEIAGFKRWTYFFEAFGKNPLFIFIMSGLLIKVMIVIGIGDVNLKTWIYDHVFISWLSGNNASLAFALAYVFLMWLLAYWLDRRKIYIKV